MSNNNPGKFRIQLQRSVLKKIIILLVAGAVLFMIGQVTISILDNEGKARSNLNMLEEVYKALYERNHALLENDKFLNNCMEILEGNEELTAIEQIYYRFNSTGEVRNQIILSDSTGDIVYSTFGEKELTSYLTNFNAAICYKVGLSHDYDIYHAVYYDTGNYADYMFVKPLYDYDREVLKGYITLFLSGSDWNFYLSDRNFDGVITDMRNNVIYCSKAKLADKVNKFYGPRSRIGYYNEERYWILTKEMPEYSVVIHSMIYYPKNAAYLSGIIIIAILSLAWYQIANWMAGSMAHNNAERIEKLVSEIRIIRKEDHRHRVMMGTDDEYEEVAYQINYMLDTIQELNDKNTELLQLNNAMEMNQLTTQMNPHFLYNTLEIIRNLVVIDGKRADELIILLTKLLRYSINHHLNDVLLEDDMYYIQAYLDIQKCRFGERFTYEIKLEEECGQCTVPKLVLQPLIENSIKYGFCKQKDIHISIVGSMQNGMLVLSVKDNGVGMHEEAARNLNASLNKVYNDTESYGLHNISRRIHLQYGEHSGLEIKTRQGQGFEVILRIIQKNGGVHDVPDTDC